MSEKKNEKRQKKTGHALYAFVVLILGIAIIAMAILLLFHVQVIEISGNKYINSSEIAASIQSDKNAKNSLYLMGKSMMGKITFPKAVESARVRMKAPWIIKVTVKEKKIVGYTIVEDEYVYFDDKGIVLSKSEVLMEKIPYIEGISVPEAKLYKELPVDEKRVFRNILEATKSFEKYKIKPERIVSSGAELTVYIGGVCAELGSGDMELKIAQIPPILQKLEGKSGTLDLRYYKETSEIISFKEGELPKTEEE